MSRTDNVVRNMYYIGYTSVIAGEDSTVFDYLTDCYGAEDEDEAIPYPVGYFFVGDDSDEDYIVYTTKDQVDRQLYAQYPSREVINRAVVMSYFNEEETRNINQMWINIRCFNIKDIPVWVWGVIAGSILILCIYIFIRKNKN